MIFSCGKFWFSFSFLCFSFSSRRLKKLNWKTVEFFLLPPTTQPKIRARNTYLPMSKDWKKWQQGRKDILPLSVFNFNSAVCICSLQNAVDARNWKCVALRKHIVISLTTFKHSGSSGANKKERMILYIYILLCLYSVEQVIVTCNPLYWSIFVIDVIYNNAISVWPF